MELREYQLLGEKIHRHRLENGLEILMDVRPEYAKQFAFFATRYGGMHLRFHNEDGHWVDTPAGVAHFLEHKMFDSEEGNVLQIMAANGAVDNAFTAAAITGYYFECTRGFEDNLRTLLSFVTTPYFTEESVAKEQGIMWKCTTSSWRPCIKTTRCGCEWQAARHPLPRSPQRYCTAVMRPFTARITWCCAWRALWTPSGWWNWPGRL